MVTASRDKTAHIWDAASAQESAASAKEIVLMGHTGSVNSAAFSPDGKKIATASDDKTSRIWDAATGETAVLQR